MLLSAMCDVFNYADDKTACCYSDFTAEVIRGLEKVALLGLYIADLLNFDVHVDNICRKAGRKLVLARLSGVLNVECKLLLFYYFILSHFEYCTAIWHVCIRDKMRKMEKLQKRALWYVDKDFNSCYTALLSELK